MIMLALSGITAFPVETELEWLLAHPTLMPSAVHAYLGEIYKGVKATSQSYPYLFYGFDWLAFAHLVIAMAFIGVYRNPVKNIWVIEWGMLSCIAVFFLALIAGPIRGIPLYWRLIDCSFGVIGIIPLWYCRKLIKQLEAKQTA
jgi:hypothetical protein